MNERKKGGAQGFGTSQSRGSHPGKPSIVQTKMPAPRSVTRPPALGLKMAGTAQVRKIPAAPPVYRPQPEPKVLQTKLRGSNQLTQTKLSPSAPQAYRPQTVPKVLQRKPAPGDLLSSSIKRAVKTAPVYAPRSTPKVLQAKTNATKGIARPLIGSARFIGRPAMAGTQLRNANATIQLSSLPAAPAPTPAPVPVLVVPVITPKSESETQKAIEAQFKLWKDYVKAGGDTTKGWNTGFNGQGGKNEYITKTDFDTLNAWWTKKTDKVLTPHEFEYVDWLTKKTLKGTHIATSVQYRTAASSQWDGKSADVLCDFLGQVGDKGGFNFHIYVIDRFKK